MADAPPRPGQGLPSHERAYLAEIREGTGARKADFKTLQVRALARFRKNQVPGHGLTEAEQVAIYEYTTDEQFIAAFNELLRERPRAADEIVFDIQSRIGKNIAQMSAKGKDYEVLFPLGAAFRVNRARWNLEAAQWQIQLTDMGRPEEG